MASFDNFSGKTVGIWGMGVEGKAARRFLAGRLKGVKLIDITENNRADLMLCDAIVKSPGVSLYRTEIKKLKERGVPVWSGTNLYMEYKNPEQRVIAVTGTKGKSTTSSLLVHTLRVLGINTGLGGNIGVPLLDLIDKKNDVVVAELSSYQCADFKGKPDIAVLLNLYPEHLHWHETHGQYYADKVSMVKQADVRIINGMDKKTGDFAKQLAGALTFNVPAGMHVENGYFIDGKEKLFPIDVLPLIGEHNALNACAVLAVIKQMGLNVKACGEAFRTFKSLPHRLEKVAEVDGITFIDDSISTTPETAVAGLKAFPENTPITLIVGGMDRGQDYDCLIAYLAQNAGRIMVVTLPDTGDAIYQFARGKGIEAAQAFDMEMAVRLAKRMTQKGGIVLLSPAAPSYNSYKNFEVRGDEFKKQAKG